MAPGCRPLSATPALIPACSTCTCHIGQYILSTHILAQLHLQVPHLAPADFTDLLSVACLCSGRTSWCQDSHGLRPSPFPRRLLHLLLLQCTRVSTSLIPLSSTPCGCALENSAANAGPLGSSHADLCTTADQSSRCSTLLAGTRCCTGGLAGSAAASQRLTGCMAKPAAAASAAAASAAAAHAASTRCLCNRSQQCLCGPAGPWADHHDAPWTCAGGF